MSPLSSAECFAYENTRNHGCLLARHFLRLGIIRSFFIVFLLYFPAWVVKRGINWSGARPKDFKKEIPVT